MLLSLQLLVAADLVATKEESVTLEKDGSLQKQEQKEEGSLTLRSDNLKKQIIELNRDLFLLEEDLLHPASTRVAVYVSMDYGSFFRLEGVKLKLDGKLVVSFLYTDKDVQALKRGAIQPLYQGNIASGEHELVAFFTGISTYDRAYKRAVSMKFEKKEGEKSFEVQVVDDIATQQPQFIIKPWDA